MQKYFSFPETQITCMDCAVPPPSGGAYRDRHGRGSGMRWTHRKRRTSVAGADGKVAWSRFPDAGINPRVKSPGGWWLTSPAHQGEREAAVKTNRAGNAGSFRRTCGDLLACFSSVHARLRVRPCIRHSLRPPFGADMEHAELGQIMPRERDSLPLLDVVARLDRAIQYSETAVIEREASGILDARFRGA